MQLFANICLLCAVFVTVYAQSTTVMTSITTNATNGAAYKLGDVISITINFNDTVTISTGGVPLPVGDETDFSYLDLANGGSAYLLASSNNTGNLTFLYTVDDSTGDSDTTSLDIDGTSAWETDPDGDGVTFLGSDGNSIDTTLSVTDPFDAIDVTIDTQAPTLAALDSVLYDAGNYSLGDVVRIYLVFDENVTVTLVGAAVPSFTIGNLTFSYVANASLDSQTLEFDYTVTSSAGVGFALSDLISNLFSLTDLHLNLPTGEAIVDVAGNAFDAADTDLSTPIYDAIIAGSPIYINSLAGAATVLQITADPFDTVLNVGDTVDINVQFSRIIYFSGLSGSNSITLALSNGGTATLVSTDGNGTDTLTFAYTVQAGDASTDVGTYLDVASASALNVAGTALLVDVVGAVAVDLTLPVGESDPNSLYNQEDTVDAGSVGITTISTPNATGTDYVFGEYLVILVNWNAAVDVTGNSSILLNTGGSAYYRSGSGTTQLTYVYWVGSSDVETSSLRIKNTSALQLIGTGSIVGDADQNDVNTTIPYQELSLGLSVIGLPDVTAALVISGSDTNACGTTGFNNDMTSIENIVYNAAGSAVGFLDTEGNCTSISKRQDFVSNFVLVFPIYNGVGDLDAAFLAKIADQINQLSSVGNVDIQIQFSSASVLVPTLFGFAILLLSLL